MVSAIKIAVVVACIVLIFVPSGALTNSMPPVPGQIPTPTPSATAAPTITPAAPTLTPATATPPPPSRNEGNYRPPDPIAVPVPTATPVPTVTPSPTATPTATPMPAMPSGVAPSPDKPGGGQNTDLLIIAGELAAIAAILGFMVGARKK